MNKKYLIVLFLLSYSLCFSKGENLVIVNNYIDDTVGEIDIVGVYIVPKLQGSSSLRANEHADWGENKLSRSIKFGRYEEFECEDNPSFAYNIKIVFDTSIDEAKRLYFHDGAIIRDDEGIVHLWITSLQDSSSPWRISEEVLKKDIREMTRSIRKSKNPDSYRDRTPHH